MSRPARRRLLPGSLAARLALLGSAGTAALVLTVGALLYWRLVENLDVAADLLLADQVRVVRAILERRPDDHAALVQEAEWESSARRYTKLYVRVFDASNRVVVETPGMAAVLPQSAFASPVPAIAEPSEGTDWALNEDRTFRLMSAQVGTGSQPLFVVQTALETDHEEDLLERYRAHLALILGLGIVISVGLGYTVATVGLRPIRVISDAAGRVHSARLMERIDASKLPAELADLAHTMNAMLDRLEESFGRLSRFSEDLAHELRTPLTNLRSGLEVCLTRRRPEEETREAMTAALEEVVGLAELVDRLLFLARAERGPDALNVEEVDVAAELESIVHFFAAAAQENSVRLEVESAPTRGIVLDRSLFRRAISNLLANALHHSAPGGRIVIRALVKTDHLEVAVEDDGEGIAAEHLPRVFDRFYRVDPSRSKGSGGVGLGLAIVKSIAKAHAGDVSIRSEVGQGTCVTLRFPLRKSP